jgi:hypothetical protein
MPLPQVTGVLWWRMLLSDYQAIYRRAARGEKPMGYTRDYLQGLRPISDPLRLMFRMAEPPYEPLRYCWGAGLFSGGRIYKAADYDTNRRVEVGQWTGVGAPAPWRLGDPASDPLVTLQGSERLRIPDEASAQWDRLSPQRPWLIMVQLEWSQSELHLRAYLGAPPPDLARASLEHVPDALRSLMNNRGGAVLGHGLPELWFDEHDFRNPWRLVPATEDSFRARLVASGQELGAAYRTGDEEAASSTSDPFEVDPEERDRATRLHAATQNTLAEAVRARGAEPRSPYGEPSYDLAWEEADGTTIVAEIKSVKATNVERQLRLALGQVLRYRDLLQRQGRTVRGVIALSGALHDERWGELCTRLGVGLIWMPDLSGMLTTWLEQ